MSIDNSNSVDDCKYFFEYLFIGLQLTIPLYPKIKAIILVQDDTPIQTLQNFSENHNITNISKHIMKYELPLYKVMLGGGFLVLLFNPDAFIHAMENFIIQSIHFNKK